MKVLHLISSIGFFGAEQVVLTLAANAGGCETVIGAISDPRQSKVEILERAQKAGVPTVLFKGQGKFDLALVSRIKNYIRNNKIDIVHTHNYKSDLIGLLASRLAGVPVVATAHGFTDMTSSVSFYEKLDRFILRFLFDRVVVVTAKMLPQIPAPKRQVIANGIDLKKFEPHTGYRAGFRARWGITNKNFVITTVGRLSREKNQAMIIKALAGIAAQNPLAVVVIVGDGPEKESLQNEIEQLKIKDHVIFTGVLDNISEALQASDVFVLSSLTEGVPITILEAMAAKVAVVATKVGGIPEMILDGQTGLLAESNNPTDLMRCLETLAGNEGMRGILVQNAYRHVSENYSVGKMIEKYQMLYQQLI